MKISIVSPYATVAPHFEAELEIAQQHIDHGDEVVFLHCLGQLANCDFNTQRDPSQCVNCVGRREHGYDLLDGKFSHQELTHHGDSFVPPEFESLQQLMDWKIDNFDIGYAALSSLVSVCRDPEPDLNRHADLLNRFISAAFSVWSAMLHHISACQPDRVYVFNGRFAAMRAVFRACQREGIECFMHERGCDKDHYDLLENHLPHSISGVDAVIRKLWSAADPNVREEVGSSWYADRVNRVERNWHSFTKEQKTGRLPEAFDASARNLSIYCSSDDEFVAIGDEWRNGLYPNQVDAIAEIAKSMLVASPETRIYLRVHPNLKDVDTARKRAMMALDFPNLAIIASEASVDSYALMRSSTVVATFGSSVGMEAVFWGRPSVLLGPCLYENLKGPIRSHSHDQTVDLLSRDLLPASDRTGALMYGHWFQTRGYRYRYFEAESLFEGTFKGQVVHDREAARKAGRKKSKLLSLFR